MNATSILVETAFGPVEYSKQGQAPYILLMHGSPGIHDGMAKMGAECLDYGFGVIAPSRPGYGRTPFGS